MEMASSTRETRKGTRQPQAANSAGLSQVCRATTWALETIMPRGPISCSTLV